MVYISAYSTYYATTAYNSAYNVKWPYILLLPVLFWGQKKRQQNPSNLIQLTVAANASAW